MNLTTATHAPKHEQEPNAIELEIQHIDQKIKNLVNANRLPLIVPKEFYPALRRYDLGKKKENLNTIEPEPELEHFPEHSQTLTQQLQLLEKEFTSLELDLIFPDQNIVHLYRRAYSLQKMLKKAKRLEQLLRTAIPSEANNQMLAIWATKIKKLEAYAKTHNRLSIAQERIITNQHSSDDAVSHSPTEKNGVETLLLQAESFLRIAIIALDAEKMQNLMKEEIDLLTEKIEILKQHLSSEEMKSLKISTETIRAALSDLHNPEDIVPIIDELLLKLLPLRSSVDQQHSEHSRFIIHSCRNTLYIKGILDEIHETRQQLSYLHTDIRHLLAAIPIETKSALTVDHGFTKPTLLVLPFFLNPETESPCELFPYPLLHCMCSQFAEKVFDSFEQSLECIRLLKKTFRLKITNTTS